MARKRRTLKQRWKQFRKPIACNCGCGKRWSRNDTLQANAHFLRHYGGYWAGQKGKAMGRKIGKGSDGLRRMGRAGWHAAGLRDGFGKLTPRGRARPTGNVRRISHLRERHRFERSATRADSRAARHERRAGRSDHRADRAAAVAGRLKQTRLKGLAQRAHTRAATHRQRAAGHRTRVADTRMAHHGRYPERTSR